MAQNPQREMLQSNQQPGPTPGQKATNLQAPPVHPRWNEVELSDFRRKQVWGLALFRVNGDLDLGFNIRVQVDQHVMVTSIADWTLAHDHFSF